MATLQLLLTNTAPPVLAEHGEEYQQFHHFRSLDQMRDHLDRLGLSAGSIEDMLAGKEIQLDADHSWPRAADRRSPI